MSHQKWCQIFNKTSDKIFGPNISSKTINKTFCRTIDEIFPPKISKPVFGRFFKNSWEFDQNFGHRQIQTFWRILEKTVFPREIRYFVGSGYFEFSWLLLTFTYKISCFTILILSLISENASFPSRFYGFRTSVLSQGFTVFSRSNFGDRQISNFCQNLEEIIFSREMRTFCWIWLFWISWLLPKFHHEFWLIIVFELASNFRKCFISLEKLNSWNKTSKYFNNPWTVMISHPLWLHEDKDLHDPPAFECFQKPLISKFNSLPTFMV